MTINAADVANGCPAADQITKPAAAPSRPVSSSEAVSAALRESLRSALTAQLPDHLNHTQQNGNTPATAAERREAAQSILVGAARRHAEAELMANRPLPGQDTEHAVIAAVLDEHFGLAGLQPLLNDPEIENINVNGCDRVFVRYADGTRTRMPAIADSELNRSCSAASTSRWPSTKF